MQVTLDHVTHTYQPGSPFQATAIEDISLEIREGDFLALIGHTGSGKSTLAQHINGLPGDTNDDGMITVADVSLSIEYILKEQADGFMKCNADVNGDGSITISDVTTIVATLMSE